MQSQLDELRRIFGAETKVEKMYISDARRLADHYKHSGAIDLVFVGPLGVIEVLCELNLQPLCAVMDRVGPEERADVVTFEGRRLRFNRFVRIIEFWVEYCSSLEPVEGVGARVLWVPKFHPHTQTWRIFRGLYGDLVDFYFIGQPAGGARDLANVLSAFQPQDIVVNGLLQVIDVLVRRGIYPIRLTVQDNRQVLRRVRVVVDRRQPIG